MSIPPRTSPRSPPSSSGSPWAARLWLAGITALVTVAVGVLVVRTGWLKNESPKADPRAAEAFPLPPISASPYRNTGRDATYVGSGVCQSCHGDRHDSFRHSGMGRSMAELDPAAEPADAVYDHSASRRRYEVYRKDGKLWHRELLLAAGPA